MKALQIVAPRTARVIDIPVPDVRDNEVLVRVRACVTCPHWDITLWRGVDIFERPGYPHYPIPPGYPGHEMSGEVVKTGPNVRELKAGKRVASLVSAGETNMGFYCEYINRPDDTVVKIPDEVSYEAGASMEMARYVAAYIRVLGDVSGKRAGVTGVGPAGLIAVQMLKALGAKEVVAVDLLEDRLSLARQLGADETVNSAAGQLAELKGRPLNVSIDCSGVSSGLQTALDNTLESVSVFGVPHGTVSYGIRHWGRNLLSRTWPTAQDTGLVMNLWQRGALNTEALVSARLPLERYEEGVQMLMDRKAIKIAFCPHG